MITTLGELPFVERPVVELLALDGDPDAPDAGEFAGFGWARVPRVWLANAIGAPTPVDDALVIAVHAADDGAPLAGDVELAFELADGDAVHAPASAFLAAWLPRLPQDVGAIVLAMCNPHGARLAVPAAARAPIYAGAGNVYAWLDDAGEASARIRLAAPAWRRLASVSNDLVHRPAAAITDDEKQTYAGLYVLKKLDLEPKDGGIEIPVVMPSELSPLDELLQQLAVDDLVSINQKKNRYELTKKGLAYLATHIDEAGELIDEFEEEELEVLIAALGERNLDPFRARFLWGWFDGEFDDLVVWQERRGLKPVERMWAFFLMGDELWAELARELEQSKN